MNKKMTLEAIRAMFKVGETWVGTNTLHDKINGPRTLTKLGSVEFRWSTADQPDFYTRFPKASEIIEARDGYVKFYIHRDRKHTLTLKKEDT
jgi:hypothetical protein